MPGDPLSTITRTRYSPCSTNVSFPVRVSTEEQHLVEKARLLLQREREYFELLQTYERSSAWAALGQALPEVFLDRKCTRAQLWDRVRKLLISRLKLQRVVVVEVRADQAQMLAPAGAAGPFSAEARAVLAARPCGYCNDPDAETDRDYQALAQSVGLHRFMWSVIAGTGDSRILIAAGFDRAKASFQSPLTEKEVAFFKNTTQHIEFLFANAQLVVELETEKALLEQRVSDRTAELFGRNRELKLVLDNIDQALATVTLDGCLQPERSRAFDVWFGPYLGKPALLEHIQPDGRFAGLFRLGLTAIEDGFLPLAVCLDQMPRELSSRGRSFACRYLPIEEAGQVLALLLVMDDVTEARQKAEAEAEQRELLAAFSALMRDRNGFLSFVEEAEQLLSRLSQGQDGATAQWGALHTLKGSAATLGLHLLASRCHTAEDELAELGHWKAGTLAGIEARWRAIRAALRGVLPASLTRTIEVSEAELQALTERAHGGESGTRIVAELRRLRAEPVRRALERQELHAKSLATRLGKPGLVVAIESDEIRLEPALWGPFWSALLHVVRNAVDHGIEPPDQRAAASKPEAGRIHFEARRSERGFRLTVTDDGRGIDWEAIRQLCRERGRPHEHRADLIEALTSEGFSTRRQVSETSGRGVGLSAVVAVVRELSGALELESEPGRGTRLTFWFATPPGDASPDA